MVATSGRYGPEGHKAFSVKKIFYTLNWMGSDLAGIYKGKHSLSNISKKCEFHYI